MFRFVMVASLRPPNFIYYNQKPMIFAHRIQPNWSIFIMIKDHMVNFHHA